MDNKVMVSREAISKVMPPCVLGCPDVCSQRYVGEEPCCEIRNALMPVRYHKKRDGIMRIEPDGSCRFLSFRETVAWYWRVLTGRAA